MGELRPDELELLESLTAEAHRIVSLVDQFANEYGQMVLHGRALPTRAAEELAVLIRCKQALDRVLTRAKGMSAEKANPSTVNRIK